MGPIDFAVTRRAFLARTAGSLGGLALAHLAAEAADPLAPKPPHHPAKAKAVICLFQQAGPSQMDLFDPKPELTKQNGSRIRRSWRSTSTPSRASSSPRRSGSRSAASPGSSCPSCCRTRPGSWTS